jgi:hypothetical protein
LVECIAGSEEVRVQSRADGAVVEEHGV